MHLEFRNKDGVHLASLRKLLSQWIKANYVYLNITDSATYGWIVTALAKLLLLIGGYTPEANRIMDRYRTGFPAELRQVCDL